MVVANNTTNMAEFLLNIKAAAPEKSSRNYSSNNYSYPQFKNILDSKTDSFQNDSRTAKTDSAAEKQHSTNKQEAFLQCSSQRTYRDVVEDRNEGAQVQSNDSAQVQSNNSAQVSGRQDDPDEVTGNEKQSKADKTKADKTKADVTLDAAAQVLGLTPAELTKLLDSMEIKTEDLADTAKIEGIASKLAGMLGLNKDQEGALKSLLVSASELTQSLLMQYSDDKTGKESVQTPEDQPVQSGPEQEQYTGTKASNVEVENITEVMARFKSKLSQLAQELQENPQSVEEKISDKVESVLQSKEKTGHLESMDNAKNVLDLNKDEAKIVLAGSKMADNGELAQHNGNDNGGPSSNQFEIASVNQVLKADSVFSSDKVQSKINVSQKDILTQVINKAKITLNGEKTEMSMELKPDSLGKLSLKVVTERGMVIAKFIAENQQVKETLEANMQLLKDSLQKQGLTVQNCSVSVGQESFKGFNGNSEYGKGEKASLNKAEIGSEIGVNVIGIPQNQSLANPYEWNDSSINLTA